MKFSRWGKGYAYPIIATILVCGLITVCCIVNGQALAEPMNDTIFILAFAQIAVAIVLGIVLAIMKPTRGNGLWIVIPLLLIAFAMLYGFIVDMLYPCC